MRDFLIVISGLVILFLIASVTVLGIMRIPSCTTFTDGRTMCRYTEFNRTVYYYEEVD